MTYSWLYSPHICYDEVCDEPHYDRSRFSRSHVLSSAPLENRTHHFRRPTLDSLPYQQSDEIHRREKASIMVPSHLTSLVSHKGHKDPVNNTRSLPVISFKAAVEKLKMTNAKAFSCFQKFRDEFKEETKPLEHYATRKLLDDVWGTKIQSFETKSRRVIRPEPSDQSSHYHQQHPQQQEETGFNLNFNDQSFLELRDDLIRRCVLMQNVRLPSWTVISLEDQERKNSTASFLKKINASIQDLIPNLQRSSTSVFAMKSALQEMDIVAKFLETYHDAWEGEWATRQEYDEESTDDHHSR